MSVLPQSLPADLPFASIRYSIPKFGDAARCEVIVGGEPVALLPATGVEFAHEPLNSLPRIKFSVNSENVDFQTYIPPRS